MRKKLGDALVQAGLITRQHLRDALDERHRTRERLGAVLVRLQLATEEQIAETLAQQLGLRYVDLDRQPPDPMAAVLIAREFSIACECVAVSSEGDDLMVAMADPLLLTVVQDLEFRTGRRIRQLVATRSGILRAIETSSHAATDAARGPERSSPVASQPPAPELVDRLLRDAAARAASDVHIEPSEHSAAIRQRIDGVLQQTATVPTSTYAEIVSALKGSAGMNPADTRTPQDGRLRADIHAGTSVDFRVVSLPTVYGESLVLTRLSLRKDVPELASLGLSRVALDEVRGWLTRATGLVVVAGPRRSGTSATLAAALKWLQSDEVSLVSIEDPIEFEIAGVAQTAVDAGAHLTFPIALESAMRQDPDAVMISELRDTDTANIAAGGSLDGPLVLAGLRTSLRAPALARLAELQVDRRRLASALVGVVEQRLVRRLCAHCRQPYTPSAAVLGALNISDALSDVDAASGIFFKAVGCTECDHTGFRGRIGVFEVMSVTADLRRSIADGESAERIRDTAAAEGMIRLQEDALAKARAGMTALEDVARLLSETRDSRTLCAGCGSVVAADHMACLRCGERLSIPCVHCGRSLHPGWEYCPFCARRVDGRPGRWPPELARRNVTGQ